MYNIECQHSAVSCVKKVAGRKLRFSNRSTTANFQQRRLHVLKGSICS